MKKSLSAILSLAMAFSMFSSVALGADAAKSSADFSDLKDLDAATKAKFDAMISAGIYDGVKEGTFGLNDKMNRAQFAKVAALIFGLTVDTSLKTSSFSDVTADKAQDPANAYALPYIEAVKAAGITDGYAPGQFNPAGEVTKEQLATFLVRGLGLEALAKANPGVSDKTVSDWAKGYVAVAIEKKVMTSGTDGTFGGTSAAVRSQLVVASFEAKKQFVPAAQVGPISIREFKASGAKTLTVSLSKPADDKLTYAVKRESSNVDVKAKLSDDKMTVTLTSETALNEGNYTVTLGGWDAKEINKDKSSASVKVEKERITKIDFVSASETIARAKDVVVEFKAVNQYGEQSSLNASNFTITSGQGSPVAVSGKQAVKLNLQDVIRDSKFAITIIHSDSGQSVSKIFTVGEQPAVSKIEVGEFIFLDGAKTLQAGKEAYLKLKALDQYGMPVTVDQVQTTSAASDKMVLDYGLASKSRGVNISVTDATALIIDNQNPFTDYDGDGYPDLKVKGGSGTNLIGNKDVTMTLFALGSGQSSTKNITVYAPKIPATIEIGAWSGTIAEGDGKKVIPLVVKNAEGVELTQQEIADVAEKFNAYTTFGATAEIPKTGADRGKLVLSGSYVKTSGQIYVGVIQTGKSAQVSVNVQEKRYPSKISVSSELAGKYIQGADGKIKVDIKDQYDEKIKDAGVYITEASNMNNYRVKALMENTAPARTGTTVTNNDALVTFNGSSDNGYSVSNFTFAADATKSNELFIEAAKAHDTDIKFKAASNKTGSFRYTLVLQKKDVATGNWSDISTTVSRTVDIITANDTQNPITYSVTLDKSVNNNTIFAAVKAFSDGIVSGATYGSADSVAKPEASNRRLLSKEVKLNGKDNGGSKVEVPQSWLNAAAGRITSSNSSVASAVYADNNKYYVVGNRAGATTINVSFYTPLGTKSATLDVTAKADVPVVDSIVADQKSREISVASLQAGIKAWDVKLMKKLTVKDQYGSEYINEKTTKSDLQKYNDILGVQYTISDIQRKSGGTDTVSVDTNGQLALTTATPGATDILSFTITATAPNGKSASVDVSFGSDDSKGN